MIKIGNVLALFYSPPSGRTAVNTLELESKGIVYDKHYDKDINRSVLIASLESYTLAKQHNLVLDHGVLGENILIDYNPYTLVSGSRLTIGEVTLEISQPCTLCKGLAQIDNKLPNLLKNDRGIFAKVVTSGLIKVGDVIYK